MNKKIALLGCVLVAAVQPAQADFGDWCQKLIIAGAAAIGVGAASYGVYTYVKGADRRALRGGDDCRQRARQLIGRVNASYKSIFNSYRPDKALQAAINKKNGRFPTVCYHDDVSSDIRKLERTERNIGSIVRDLTSRAYKASIKDDEASRTFVVHANNLCEKLNRLAPSVAALTSQMISLRGRIRNLPAYDKELQQQRIEELERKAQEQQWQINQLEARLEAREAELNREKWDHRSCTKNYCYYRDYVGWDPRHCPHYRWNININVVR